MTTNKKIAIFIIAYNASTTLVKVLERIPEEIIDLVTEIFVFDDCSKDDTYLVGTQYKSNRNLDKLNIYRNEVNQGYGGNQKVGYNYAIEKSYDYVILLHGDAQYAPEELSLLLQPILNDKAEVVFGSRMMIPRQALQGGMPFYKYLGNKILTAFQNFALDLNMSEFHSGYRIYSCKALEKIPYNLNTNNFHFDTEIIIQLKELGTKITELPISCHYGDEICYVNGLGYAKNVVKTILGYKFLKKRFKHLNFK